MKSLLSFISKQAILGASAVLAVGVFTPSASYAMTMVDTELYLSVDTSGSVSSSEFDLQRQGYANSFLSPAIQNLIASTPNGIAAALGYWSSSNQQVTAVPFTLIKTATDATDFATLISNTTRPFSGGTSIG